MPPRVEALVSGRGDCLRMDFQAAIFDLDGTLVNSMDVWEKIDAQFLSKQGLPVPPSYVRKFVPAALRKRRNIPLSYSVCPKVLTQSLKNGTAWPHMSTKITLA